MHRRTVLSGLTTVGTVTIAGCSGGGNGGSGGGNDGPAETLESYRASAVEGDVEAANEEIYDDGEWNKLPEDAEEFDGEVLNNEIREVTVSEAAELAGIEEEAMTDAMEARMSNADADDYAVVYWLSEIRTAEGEEATDEFLVLLMEFNGEWLIHSYAPGGLSLS